MIQSTNNPYIKELAKLKQKKYREEKQMFLVEGDHLVLEAYKQNILEEVFILEGVSLPFHFGKVTVVSLPVLEKLTFSKTPQKMVGLCHYLQMDYDFSSMKRVFLLDGLQDPGNIGTIIRTALAMSFDAVVLSNDSVDLYNDKLLRACQGANFYLPVFSGDMKEMIVRLQKSGFKVYATALRNAKVIDAYENVEKMAFVMGNEGNGVKDEDIDLCDGAMYIPISKAESLNVAICAGMVAFNFRQK